MPVFTHQPGALKRSTRALATAVDAPASTSSSAPPAAPPASGSKSLRAGINTAIILNRAPILTRAPTPFEKAYYQYQQRIQRALHNPFAYDFYFKPGAPLEGAFNLAEAKRDRKAFGKGFGMDAEGAFAPPAAGAPELGAEEEEPTAPRFTAADEKGDVKSLDRYGQRNLYLLIQKKVGGKQVWAFPEGGVESDELLHEASSKHAISCTDYLSHLYRRLSASWW
jgi:large subunit ribosomal protein L46